MRSEPREADAPPTTQGLIGANGKVIVVATRETDSPLAASTPHLNEIQVLGCLAYAEDHLANTIAGMARGGSDRRMGLLTSLIGISSAPAWKHSAP